MYTHIYIYKYKLICKTEFSPHRPQTEIWTTCTIKLSSQMILENEIPTGNKIQMLR